MRNLLLIAFIGLFIACSFDAAEIEFDNENKNLSVLSEYYGISYILVNKIENGKQLDSTYASVDFDVPQDKVDLKNPDTQKRLGKPLAELLGENDLIYKVVLKPHNETDKKVKMIVFKTSDVQSSRQIFESF